MRETPRIVFLDINGREILRPAYRAPDMSGIALQDQNGQLRHKGKLADYAAALNAIGDWKPPF